MASSYLNIITFLLTTLFYYLAIKPSFTYDMSVDPQKNKQYKCLTKLVPWQKRVETLNNASGHHLVVSIRFFFSIIKKNS